MRRTNTPFLLGILAAACVAAIGAYVFAFSLVKNGNREAAALLIQIDQAGRKQERAAALRDTVTRTEAARKELESYFVGKEGVVEVIRLVEDLGAKAGTNLSIARVDVLPADDFFETVTLDIAASGSRAGLLRLVSMLERMPYAAEFSAASLTEDQAERAVQELGGWTGSFSLKLKKLP
jgi:hypothetical protein